MQFWYEIHENIIEMERMIAKAAAIDLESQKKPEKEKNDEHIIELRSSLREKLSLLKNELGSELNDRELYLVLFPLVVHIDEKVNANLSFRSSGLPPLQKELYGKENGGELFYQLTEDLLTKPLINNLIYEVFYFCLSNGFKGKYIQDEMSIESYKSRLASKISLSTKLPNHDHISSDSQVKFYGFPYKYYLAGALGTFVTLLTLIFLSEA